MTLEEIYRPSKAHGTLSGNWCHKSTVMFLALVSVTCFMQVWWLFALATDFAVNQNVFYSKREPAMPVTEVMICTFVIRQLCSYCQNSCHVVYISNIICHVCIYFQCQKVSFQAHVKQKKWMLEIWGRFMGPFLTGVSWA